MKRPLQWVISQGLVFGLLMQSTFNAVAIAQTPETPKLPKFDTCTLDPDLLTPAGLPLDSNWVTAYTFNPETMTQPSLWWAAEQFGPNKMIVNWIAYPEQRQIDLILNLQLWSSLNYIGRYSFIHHFGTVARDYGYNLRLFDQRPNCLAVYTCNYTTAPPNCTIEFDPVARGRFRF
jgi:hypothetical protein